MKHLERHWLFARFPFLPESADAVSYYLFERGALGCEEKDGCFFAYFEDQDSENLLAKLEQDARQITASGLKLPFTPIMVTRIPEQDWRLGWRRFFKPVNIDNKLIVRPPWENIVLPPNAVEIILEPKQAFGTGAHSTTKLMLRAITEKADALPNRALDVGTGSGILAIAHALLNRKAQILACDLDPVAIDNAVENANTNNVADKIDFFVGGVDGIHSTRLFPLIYANLQRHIIIPILPKLFSLLTKDGMLLLSGILNSEENMIRSALAKYPCAIAAIHQEDEWILIEAMKEKWTTSL